MNAYQKQAVGFGIFLFVAMHAFPPWTDNGKTYRVSFRSDSTTQSGIDYNPPCPWQHASCVNLRVSEAAIEYGFLFDHPYDKSDIATGRLILQWLILAITLAGAFALYSGPDKLAR